MVLKCECRHESQDKMYGYEMRYHNKTIKVNEYRCTVCEKTHTAKG
jgi:hypothetical protein